jgi:3-dehydroquinate synthase
MPLIERFIQVTWQLRVFFTDDVFAPANPLLCDVIAGARLSKALVVLEDSLAQKQPELEGQIEKYFAAHAEKIRLVRSPLFVSGGEAAKNSITLVTDILSQIDRHHIDRHAYVIAVGGGALLDVVGFTAATAHRGVRLVRVPTTTLSQAAESGIGVKTSINAFGKKNFVGTFTPPFAVLNDFNLLATLDPRDKRSGYAEAVKIACVRDAEFLAEIERDADKLMVFEPEAMKHLIRRCAELHLDHIANGGDPFDAGSARPLEFGHWAAYKIEELSRFRLRHSEAVAIGIALDAIYSRESGLLDAASVERILKLLERLGFKLFADELLNTTNTHHLAILSGLEEYREHLGGELSITLLKAIGQSVETHEMDPAKIVKAIYELHRRNGDVAGSRR